MKESLKNIFFKIWYWYVSTIDTNADVTFMNYGYSKDDHKIKLDEIDEQNRYSVQLYDLVARGADINKKDIVEIGCGRGGGISYINRCFSPGSSTGLDLNNKAIEFCKEHYSNEGINFVQGDARSLPFPDDTFDVVINVESSHRYQHIDRFFSEVHRVLRPGGFFLFADFRPKNKLGQLQQQLADSKFKIVKNDMITKQVLEALKLSSNKREELIHMLTPKLLQSLGKKFAATEGTPTYNKFASREFEYFFYVVTHKFVDSKGEK